MDGSVWCGDIGELKIMDDEVGPLACVKRADFLKVHDRS
jgi:hypothetical protein